MSDCTLRGTRARTARRLVTLTGRSDVANFILWQLLIAEARGWRGGEGDQSCARRGNCAAEDMAERDDIFVETVRHFLRPVGDALEDPSVSEVMINGPDAIYVERDGRLSKVDASFASEESLMAAIRNVLQFAGKRITPESLLIDARLPDGSRVHVVLPPSSLQGPCMAIRKFEKSLFNMQALIGIGALTPMAAEFLQLCVLAEKNIMVAGGTSSGKTSLLNALSAYIPEGLRIVVIEDSSELQLQQEHVLRMECRPPDRYGRGEITIRDLFRSCLRLRPDRIVIGEVRGAEALDLIQAMTSGHGGSMSTMHANTPADALNRLETLAMMANVELPLYALRAQVASAIDVLVQVSRFADGSRGLTHISEVLGVEGGSYKIQDVFSYVVDPVVGDKRGKGTIKWTGGMPMFRHEPALRRLGDKVQLCNELFADVAMAGSRAEGPS